MATTTSTEEVVPVIIINEDEPMTTATTIVEKPSSSPATTTVASSVVVEAIPLDNNVTTRNSLLSLMMASFNSYHSIHNFDRYSFVYDKCSINISYRVEFEVDSVMSETYQKMMIALTNIKISLWNDLKSMGKRCIYNEIIDQESGYFQASINISRIDDNNNNAKKTKVISDNVDVNNDVVVIDANNMVEKEVKVEEDEKQEQQQVTIPSMNEKETPSPVASSSEYSSPNLNTPENIAYLKHFNDHVEDGKCRCVNFAKPKDHRTNPLNSDTSAGLRRFKTHVSMSKHKIHIDFRTLAKSTNYTMIQNPSLLNSNNG